jgi:hypothetical protein
MIRTATLTLAAALLAGSTLVASADTMINDSNTGLDFRYFNGTLAELQQQGAPLSASSAAYLKSHGGHVNASHRRGQVYMLEDRAPRGAPVYGAYTDYTSHYGSFDDKQRPW